tara:strand:- start:514 stop:1482 length:969 start_codon:yes stop_codon:yes gene_type:complete
MFMMHQILIHFCVLASIFLTSHAQAQHMGTHSKQNAMGHIDKVQGNRAKADDAPQAPKGSDLPGAQAPAPIPAADALELPQADFTPLRQDRNDRILDIIDPLTIRGEKIGIIRLSGLDIPDYNPYQQGPLAESAAYILRDMLSDTPVRLYHTRDKTTGRKNRMNQSLYHVVIADSESWVQGILVRLGLARVRTDPSTPEMARDLYTLETQAREEKLGLWAFDHYKVLSPDEASAHLNTFAIVEGKVVSAARKQNNIYLNFGQNWREDFTIQVKPINARRFDAAGINLLNLNGQTIRVRGWLQSYNGPYIEIDHPERIEIISP